MRARVYILGAGASAGYKNSLLQMRSPVAKEFFSTSIDLILQGHLSQIEYYHLLNFVDRYYGSHIVDIEELLTIFDIDRHRFRDERNELIRLIFLTLNKILYGSHCQYHERLIRALDDEDTLITFNWDLLLDNILSSNQSYPKYCCDFASVYVDGRWNSSRTRPNGPKLLKLHGSLNWMDCINCNKAYSYINAGKIAAEQLVAPGHGYLKCPKCRQLSLRPIIIPPTLNKPFHRWRIMETIWQEAAAALKNADEITIVGYSLPVTDFLAKWLFTESAANRTKILKKLTVLDKYPGRLFEKYKQIFRVSDENFTGIQGEICDLKFRR